MDQHELVRKSVARISFKWQNNPHKKDKIVTVVIPGTIVSIKDDGSCVVIAEPTFFREKNCPFVVNLPIAGGYDDVPVAPSMLFFVQGFCALVLQLQPSGYAQPVTFLTRPVLTLDRVYAFMFQQNVVSTATAYCPGSIFHGEEGQWGKLSIGIPFHSYGRFGSPIFNQSGHLVGISRTPMEAWSVNFLQQTVFRGPEMSSVLGSVSYVLNGNTIPPEGPILPEGPVLPV